VCVYPEIAVAANNKRDPEFGWLVLPTQSVNLQGDSATAVSSAAIDDTRQMRRKECSQAKNTRRRASHSTCSRTLATLLSSLTNVFIFSDT
jgi:hypothetical protein